jgi:hypothetical protein
LGSHPERFLPFLRFILRPHLLGFMARLEEWLSCRMALIGEHVWLRSIDETDFHEWAICDVCMES